MTLRQILAEHELNTEDLLDAEVGRPSRGDGWSVSVHIETDTSVGAAHLVVEAERWMI